MANPAYGFRYAKSLIGADEVIRQYIHAAADGTAIGKGDLVDVTGAADTVKQGVAANPVIGIGLNYAAASTLVNVDVLELHSQAVLQAYEDGVGGSIAAASEALNANFIVASANTTTGLSQMMVDSSTAATTNTLDLLLYEPAPLVSNVVASNAQWFVLPNNLRRLDQKVGIS